MIIALNEVYYGKTKNLIEAEKLLAQVKADYDGDYYNVANVMVDERYKKMQDLIAKEFGLKNFYLYAEPVKEINAMTLPLSWAIECMPTCRLNKNLIVDKKGMRFREEAGLSIETDIYSGLLLNPNYSAGEIIGIILHEIGHNFQSVIDDTMFYLTDATHMTTLLRIIISDIMRGWPVDAVMDALTPITASNFIKNISIEIDRALMGIDWIRFILNIYSNIAGRVKSAKYMIIRIINSIMGFVAIANPAMIIKQIVQGVIETILDPLGYRGEQIADSFATIYGYGPELSSALMRMQTEHDFGDNYEKVLNKSIFGQILRTGYGVVLLSVTVLDVHPNAVERCLAQVRYLKAELDKGKMSPELRRDIKRQIDQIEDNLEDIMSNPNLEERWDIFRYAYATAIYNSGGDFRHNTFMGKDINKNIQKRYDSPKNKIRLI